MELKSFRAAVSTAAYSLTFSESLPWEAEPGARPGKMVGRRRMKASKWDLMSGGSMVGGLIFCA